MLEEGSQQVHTADESLGVGSKEWSEPALEKRGRNRGIAILADRIVFLEVTE